MNTDNGWGFSHLANLPQTVSFGTVLIVALIALLILRLVFADVTVRGGVK